MKDQQAKQLIFDTVVKHLRKQGKKSTLDGTFCQYRSPEGLKCAIGALFPDELYQPIMDESGHNSVRNVYSLLGIALDLEAETFLDELQDVHDKGGYDNNGNDTWEYEMHVFAERYNLNFKRI